jgi:hypothetical protein
LFNEGKFINGKRWDLIKIPINSYPKTFPQKAARRKRETVAIIKA